MAFELDFNTFFKIAPKIMDANLPVMIRGRHGIGKSEVVYWLADLNELPVVERRASQMTEGDLVGLPVTDGDRTSWNPPDWFKTACERPVLLFLDEVDRAIPEVRQGIFELTDSRKLNGHFLHEGTKVFAAVNGGVNGAEYQVGEMDPAELDRWTCYDLNPSRDDWYNWAQERGGVEPLMVEFLRQHPDHLEHVKGTFEPNKVYPSRRSWVRLDKTLREAKMYEEYDHLINMLALGFVGDEAAIAFADFFKNYERQVTVENILDEGRSELTKGFSLSEHCNLIDKMIASKRFEKVLKKKEINNLAKYVFDLPSEATMKLYLDLGDPKNVVALHNAKVDGKELKAQVVEYLAGVDLDKLGKKEEED